MAELESKHRNFRKTVSWLTVRRNFLMRTGQQCDKLFQNIVNFSLYKGLKQRQVKSLDVCWKFILEGT